MAALPKIGVSHPKGLDDEYLVPDVALNGGILETYTTPVG